MDIKTLILTLAIGNFIFGLALFLFQLREEKAHRNWFWTVAKTLQCCGWYLLYLRGTIPDTLSVMLGNILLLSGFAYECWAVCRISGRTVGVALQISVVVGITIIWCTVTSFSPAIRIAVSSFISAIFFLLGGSVMLFSHEQRSLLRDGIGVSMWLLTLVVVLRGFQALISPEGFSLFSVNVIQEVTFLSLYGILLTNGFGVLLLTKERADRALRELSQEQRAILDTLPTGLCVLKNRVIERCNPAMEAMFGFSPGTMVGQSVRCLFASDEVFAEYGRKIYSTIEREGHFVGEVAYMRQNGESFWALDHGTALFPDRPQSYAVFSLIDITERLQQQEELLQQKRELEATLARTKRLEGIISICMYCKKIENKKESWDRLETYITEHTDALFSHGICPDCLAREHPLKT